MSNYTAIENKFPWTKFPKFSKHSEIFEKYSIVISGDGEGGREDCPLVPSEGRA